MKLIETVDELLVHELEDLYSAEDQLVAALPLMASAASAPELRLGFEQHYNETTAQRERVSQALGHLGRKPDSVVCEGVRGLIAEGKSIMQSVAHGPVLDAALIDAGRKVEHYEIVAYRGALSKAHELGLSEIATLLQSNLQEEELTDQKLQQLAQGMMPYSGPGPDPRDDGSEVIVGSRPNMP